MTTQPEALRLADELEDASIASSAFKQTIAAELRRLHKEVREWDRVCDQHLRHIDKLKKRMKRAEALNQELLAALNAMLTHMGMDEDEWNKPTFDQARAIIAKAEGQT